MDRTTIAVFTTWLVLNGLASFVVLRDQASPPRTRLLQLLLVWALPALGAILCLVAVSAQARRRASPMDRTAFTENAGAAEPDIDMPPGSSICGCPASGGGADGGD